MQSLSNQPTQSGSLMVPPFFESICGTLPMFSSPQIEHKHPAKHQNCVYHKDHGHTTEQCRSLHYLVERLIKVGHLKQYICIAGRPRETAQNLAVQVPSTSATPKVVINYIHGGPVNEKYHSKRKKKKKNKECATSGQHNNLPANKCQSGTSPHKDTLILTLRISGFNVRRVLIDPGSLANLFWSDHPKHAILNGKGFIPFNAIMGRTWLYNMKVIPSTYHQMVSYLTKDGQIDLFSSKLVARQCYQVALEFELPSNSEPRPEPSNTKEQ
ncbi:hypothetical protein AAG906_013627 [Vitis piasezkii]